MAGHVDEAERAFRGFGGRRSGDRRVGVTEVDGNAAVLFFLQPVAVDAGERFDERRFAVVDVAGGADQHGLVPARSGSVSLASATSWASEGPLRPPFRQAAQVQVQCVVAHMRPMTGSGSPRSAVSRRLSTPLLPALRAVGAIRSAGRRQAVHRQRCRSRSATMTWVRCNRP